MKERRKEGLRSRQERIANEILMHFRAQKKLQGEVSLSDTMENGGDGNSLSLMDVIAVDDNMLEDLDTRDACRRVRQCVGECLNPRERAIITLRYGLDDQPPRTQREVAARCGISRSYVSQRRYCKRFFTQRKAPQNGAKPCKYRGHACFSSSRNRKCRMTSFSSVSSTRSKRETNTSRFVGAVARKRSTSFLARLSCSSGEKSGRSI